MRNVKKSLLSALAGVALIAGTGSTFALWTATAERTIDPVQTGNIAFDTTSVTWQDRSDRVMYPRTGANRALVPNFGKDGAPASLTAFQSWDPAGGYYLSPGDRIVATVKVPFTISGTNLAASLSFEGGAGTTGKITVTPRWVAGQTLENLVDSGTRYIEVEIYFDSNATEQKGVPVNLSAAQVTLSQVRPVVVVPAS